MNSHTPGPWHARRALNGYLIEAGRNVRIVRGSGGIKSEADAHLAAAAPVLLEALRIITEGDGADRFLTWGEREQARKAIAEAEGRP